MNIHASKLGKLAKGIPKTMSEQALQQRRTSAQISVQKRREKKLKLIVDRTKAVS